MSSRQRSFDTPFKDGKVPLVIAAEKGWLELVKFLLDEGKADVNVQDEEGNTAIMMAYKYDHLNVIRALIQRGANMLLKNKKGQDALSIKDPLPEEDEEENKA